jgi:hypothetical protein
MGLISTSPASRCPVLTRHTLRRPARYAVAPVGGTLVLGQDRAADVSADNDNRRVLATLKYLET